MSETRIYLLFPPDMRPDRHELAEFANAVDAVTLGHANLATGLNRRANGGQGQNMGPKPGKELGPEPGWVELLRNGLTFDLHGLPPGRGGNIPHVKNAYDFADLARIDRLEAAVVMPGPHLTGGMRSLPVLRGMMALACDMVRFFDRVEGIIWPPSRSVTGRRYFESTVSAWLEGGPFPALGLTSFSEMAEGGLQSNGLAQFIDRELRIEPPLTQDKAVAMRLGMRLISHLVLIGGIHGEERLITPDGTRLIMRESENRRFIRAWAE